jgi:hypothetical protein
MIIDLQTVFIGKVEMIRGYCTQCHRTTFVQEFEGLCGCADSTVNLIDIQNISSAKRISEISETKESLNNLKTCPNCEQEFPRGRKNKVYCSAKCANKAWIEIYGNRPDYKLTCRNQYLTSDEETRRCTNTFISKNPNKKYCSTLCMSQVIAAKRKYNEEQKKLRLITMRTEGVSFEKEKSQ